MTAAERHLHAIDVRDVQKALEFLNRISEPNSADESIAVARARLEYWLAENVGRWVA